MDCADILKGICDKYDNLIIMLSAISYVFGICTVLIILYVRNVSNKK